RTPAAPDVGALRKFLPRAPRCELGHDLLLRPRGTKVFSELLTSFGHVSTLALQPAPPITRWCTSRRDRAPTPWWCAPAGAASIPRKLTRSPPFPVPVWRLRHGRERLPQTRSPAIHRPAAPGPGRGHGGRGRCGHGLDGVPARQR